VCRSRGGSDKTKKMPDVESHCRLVINRAVRDICSRSRDSWNNRYSRAEELFIENPSTTQPASSLSILKYWYLRVTN
jgi:hypothetical protein